MTLRTPTWMRVCAALLLCAWPAAASASEAPPFLRALDRMMVALGPESARAGATILPAAPGFYHRPTSIDDLVDFVVARILDHLGVEHAVGKRWKSGER